MKVLPLSEVKSKLSEQVDLVEPRDEEVTTTRNGRTAAVLISKAEYEGWRETVEITKDRHS
jgi:prevent-host-death family protein